MGIKGIRKRVFVHDEVPKEPNSSTARMEEVFVDCFLCDKEHNLAECPNFQAKSKGTLAVSRG